MGFRNQLRNLGGLDLSTKACDLFNCLTKTQKRMFYGFAQQTWTCWFFLCGCVDRDDPLLGEHMLRVFQFGSCWDVFFSHLTGTRHCSHVTVGGPLRVAYSPGPIPFIKTPSLLPAVAQRVGWFTHRTWKCWCSTSQSDQNKQFWLRESSTTLCRPEKILTRWPNSQTWQGLLHQVAWARNDGFYHQKIRCLDDFWRTHNFQWLLPNHILPVISSSCVLIMTDYDDYINSWVLCLLWFTF